MPNGWRERPLGSFTERVKEINLEGRELEPLSVTKGEGVVLQSSRFKKRVATDLRKYQIARRGDFIYDPMSLYYGSVGRLDVIAEGVTSPDYVVFQPDGSVDSDFLLYLLRWPRSISVFEAHSERGNRAGKRRRLYWSGFKDIAVRVPPLPEQRKIAAILSSVDEAIAATQAVIDQVQVVKKGLMQELLTRGLPGRHRKFKQTGLGQIPREWEVVRLDEACECLDHIRVPIKAADRRNMAGDIPYYGASGIIDHVNDHLFDEDLVLLSEDGANILSRNHAVAFKISGKAWVNNHAHVFRPRPGVDHDFLVEHLESLDYAEYSTGTAQPKLNRKTCNALPVPMPPEEEQARIGEICRAQAARLRAEGDELVALQSLKSALLSVLLTGELRVELEAAE